MRLHGVGLVIAGLLLAGCSGGESPSSLADKMATADGAAPARYEAAFTDLMAHCSDSASKVAGAIDTDAHFLSNKGYPGGASEWQFMRALRRVVGSGSKDCSSQAALIVQASGVQVP